MLVFTDTDSSVLKIDTDYVYEDPKEINKCMALSGSYASHPNCGKMNQKVLGTLEDEFNGPNGHIITNFIGLKLKSCGFKVYSEKKKHKKAKV